MSTIDVVKRSLASMESTKESEGTRDRNVKDMVFPDWANTKVLMDANATSAALAEQNNGNIGLLLQAISDIFEELNVPRLSPALRLNDDEEYIFIVVV